MLTPIQLLVAIAITISLTTGCVPKKRVKTATTSVQTAPTAYELDASSKIAVMLPSSGKYSKAASAIRTGMEFVNNRQTAEHRPQLLFLNSSEGVSDALINQTSSADMLVGPLTKENVGQLMQTPANLPRTVIALNHVSNTSPVGFYQFGLSPDDDARQVAQKAYDDGLRTASVLYPDTDWGSRHLEGFTEHWQALGGVLGNSASYPLEGDATQAIKSLLQNHGDFVYLVAKPAKARELRSFLLYYGNFKLPVYFSSRAYDRRLYAHDSGDLTASWMPAMPIAVPDAQQAGGIVPTWEDLEAFPGFDASLAEFYALGADAMYLAINAYQLEAFRELHGATGNLYADQQGVIRRQPIWIYYGDEISISPTAPSTSP